MESGYHLFRNGYRSNSKELKSASVSVLETVINSGRVEVGDRNCCNKRRDAIGLENGRQNYRVGIGNPGTIPRQLKSVKVISGPIKP